MSDLIQIEVSTVLSFKRKLISGCMTDAFDNCTGKGSASVSLILNMRMPGMNSLVYFWIVVEGDEAGGGGGATILGGTEVEEVEGANGG